MAKFESKDFVIYGVKGGWTKEKTLKHIAECQTHPSALGCPRCKTHLAVFSTGGIALCLICHIRFTWDDKKRILPPIGACHDIEHERARQHIAVPYTNTIGKDEYLHECLGCWDNTLKAMDRNLVQWISQDEYQKMVARIHEMDRSLTAMQECATKIALLNPKDEQKSTPA